MSNEQFSTEITTFALTGKTLTFYFRQTWWQALLIISAWVGAHFLQPQPVFGDKASIVFWVIAVGMLVLSGFLSMRAGGDIGVAATAGSVAGLLAGFGIAAAALILEFSGWQFLRFIRDPIAGGVGGYCLGWAASFAFKEISRRSGQGPQPPTEVSSV